MPLLLRTSVLLVLARGPAAAAEGGAGSTEVSARALGCDVSSLASAAGGVERTVMRGEDSLWTLGRQKVGVCMSV